MALTQAWFGRNDGIPTRGRITDGLDMAQFWHNCNEADTDTDEHA